jgi:aerobic-type carbon monoxide dehydrogenase small subunit (CoxS/CutS family)
MCDWAELVRRLRSMKSFERQVTCELDGVVQSFTAWSDMSALLAIRLILKHPRPERGCEVGTCGSCESLLNGDVVRLCQVLSTDLDGTQITTSERA